MHEKCQALISVPCSTLQRDRYVCVTAIEINHEVLRLVTLPADLYEHPLLRAANEEPTVVITLAIPRSIRAVNLDTNEWNRLSGNRIDHRSSEESIISSALSMDLSTRENCQKDHEKSRNPHRTSKLAQAVVPR